MMNGAMSVHPLGGIFQPLTFPSRAALATRNASFQFGHDLLFGHRPVIVVLRRMCGDKILYLRKKVRILNVEHTTDDVVLLRL